MVARRTLLVISLCLGLFLSAARAEKFKDLQPQGYVNDFAGVLNAQTQAQITELCKEVDEKTQAQIAVVSVKTLEGLEAQDFANQLYKKWGVGHKGENRGVLILLAFNDHKYWTEVGYGLEPVLPDGKVGGFGRDMVPSLRAGDTNGALLRITAQIAEVIGDDRGVDLDTLANLGFVEAYVHDLAMELGGSTVARVKAVCAEVEQKVHAQIVVVITASLANLEPDEFARRAFNKYHVGRKDEGRGVLILLLPNHRYRMIVSSGLASILTNEKLETFGHEIEPFLSANDYDGAVAHLTANLAEAIAAERGISLESLAALSLKDEPENPLQGKYPYGWYQIFSTIFVLIIPVAFIWFLIQLLRGKLKGGGKSGRIYYSSGSSRGGGYTNGGGFGGSSSGGGYEGSSGGSFGGFGGGSSGGGGAGGSW
jgi:uncharacterized membrane protein YgcG